MPPELGNYYAPQDYAGLFRRFLIVTVDGLFAGVGLFLIVGFGHRQLPGSWLAWACVGFLFVYFVLLESTVGTVGFWLANCRIVTLRGDRPSILRMTFRLLLWILGPLNALVDLYWMTGDEYRQTLRDKFAGTLVIRKGATPAGTGEIRLNRYQLMGHSLVFYEVQRPGPSGTPGVTSQS